jgi:hypothetical protein
MSMLNAVLRRLCDVLMAPAGAVPPLVSLLVVSLLTAIVMLLVIKHTSNQAGITEIKQHIYACLFEIRLYLDDSEKGGLQVYAVVASAEPLPAYEDWRRARTGLSWKARNKSMPVLT